jgi:hypothetical protein
VLAVKVAWFLLQFVGHSSAEAADVDDLFANASQSSIILVRAKSPMNIRFGQRQL